MKLAPGFAKLSIVAASVALSWPLCAKPAAKPAPAPAKQEVAPAGDEAEPTIPGMELPRSNGGFVGLTLEGALDLYHGGGGAVESN